MELILKDILENLLLSISILLASGVSYWIKQKVGKSKIDKFMATLDQKKELVSIAIKFVEVAYKDLDGEVKYSKAVEWVKMELDKLGLKYTNDELKALIESTLKSFKDEASKQR
ncbi:hypothetical protein BRE01_64290 [Brevibacillus reuszeri]|uniref:Phage holin n=1 Tax=Brevibacillus reuszeri TaxID=54915 RepID=A0A0K9YWC0_9BACL|nr:phage holin, LLH family [Brevibacillus reuszeri]KNB72917.1 hypothetical protein ADS79_13895 [Brevibacillus reuszeri]MED1861717.1 phage holin, LLH family [Brevibacillus reuszeri]GED72727.1 hypothetical protein BRE01_64290 [Brevibacillus reuszeri]